MIAILDAAITPIKDIIKRETANLEAAQKAALQIIAKVKAEGDSALIELAKKYDKADISCVKVSQQEIEDDYNAADAYFIETLEQAAANIAAFHKAQLRKDFRQEKANGVIVGQRYSPINKAGLYIPGGTAGYPSTVLMNAIPAIIAGVKEIVIVTPPLQNGGVNPDVLTAARVAGIRSIFKVGGAQAIAALAYGTQSIPKVDKITGPGNIYVAAAKRLVSGEVSIDMIAGPSEILIIADSTANPAYIAADMLSQAEHDRDATAILVTTDKAVASGVVQELEAQLSRLPREGIARESIYNNGKIILAQSLQQAAEISNAIAPEHLELCVNNPFDLLDSITNAGSVFLGGYTPEAVGDYFAGTNHTLPTNGTARFASALSVDDFVKKTQYVYYTRKALQEDGDRIAYFANKEGLTAHANSVTVRMDNPQADNPAKTGNPAIAYNSAKSDNPDRQKKAGSPDSGAKSDNPASIGED